MKKTIDILVGKEGTSAKLFDQHERGGITTARYYLGEPHKVTLEQRHLKLKYSPGDLEKEEKQGVRTITAKESLSNLSKYLGAELYVKGGSRDYYGWESCSIDIPEKYQLSIKRK